ncbi:hypothetical protein [Streptomyces sp. JB150]|uniref:hypothetical protein n=1 Tax=Streptomyces sp. JB150 TaxID=2714844 RepID=UPI00140C5CDD|nr:hypothetical protein [Streptomyces sp. JB150]QIJ60577.1 hypothetical protein G7Z13_02160 [Streptomyces sp. JB150]
MTSSVPGRRGTWRAGPRPSRGSRGRRAGTTRALFQGNQCAEDFFGRTLTTPSVIGAAQP